MSETNSTMPKQITSNSLFIQWLREHEIWLMERILKYAKEHDYTRYTSTLIEPWRISIVGLTDSLELLMNQYSTPPVLGPDDDYYGDPASAFGLLEAQRHRSRGVNFAMFISLFKYYRQTFHDLIETNQDLFEDPKFYYEYVKRFFDRVEIAYSIEWHGRSAEDQIHELSTQNRHLTNEKNLYLTVFDSFSSGSILLDSYGLIINYNQSASSILFGKRHHGGSHYYGENKTISTPEWIIEAIENLGDNDSHRFFYEQLLNNERFIYDVFIRPMDDISGKFSGFIVILNDVTTLKMSQEQFELAINATKDGLWDWNLINNNVYFSPHWKEMLGYRDEELPNALQTWVDLVHPDDLASANKAIDKCLQSPGIEFEHIHRLRHKDGHYIWNLDRGEVLFNDEGKAVRMLGFHTDITHLKEIEENLSILKMAIESAPISFVITDVYGNFEYINPWFSNLTGYSFQEVIGKNPKILKSGFTTLSEYRIMWDKISHEHPWQGKFKNIKKNGDEYWERATILPIKNTKGEISHYLGIMEEITESQYLKTLLLQKEEKIHYLAELLEEANTEIYIFDAQTLGFLYSNKSALANTGYSAEEMYRLTPLDIKPMKVEEFKSYLSTVDDKGSASFGTEHERKDGSHYPVTVILQPTYYEDRRAYVSMITDISTQKEMLSQINETQELMIAQSRHAAMGEMIGMIAHQWRQPLSIVSMMINNMLIDLDFEGLDVDQCRTSGEGMLEQVNYLSSTIDVFRDFFRPDKVKESIEIVSIMKEALAMIDASLQNNNISISLRNEAVSKVKVYPRELLQVFVNIIKNAKEALMINGIQKGHIDIIIEEKENRVISRICDNAGGIDPMIMGRIFDPYFSTKDEKTGTGLGLYMSKTIVEKHLGGIINALNNDEGVCFIISFESELS